jgi:drug/metabolite transporter (DMT)-like permease
VNLDNVTREDWTVGGLAVVLAIFLLVLPWFDLSIGPFSATLTATDGPDGWLGILAVIAALAVVADLAVEKLSPQTELPQIGGSRADTRFILTSIAAVFVALKFLFHIHFDLFGWGFYVCVVVTVALVYFAAQARSAAPSVASYPTPPPAPPSEPAGTGSGPTSGSTPPPGS